MFGRGRFGAEAFELRRRLQASGSAREVKTTETGPHHLEVSGRQRLQQRLQPPLFCPLQLQACIPPQVVVATYKLSCFQEAFHWRRLTLPKVGYGCSRPRFLHVNSPVAQINKWCPDLRHARDAHDAPVPIHGLRALCLVAHLWSREVLMCEGPRTPPRQRPGGTPCGEGTGGSELCG